MERKHDIETVDVVICGCGPVGAMLSAYLCQLGISNIVLEKEAKIVTDPRAIALDEDGIRCIQGLGLYDKIFSEIGVCMNKFFFIGGTEKSLEKKPFIQFDYDTTEGGTGHVGFICHKQPAIEANIRKLMEASEYCKLRPQSLVKGLSEDDQWAYCHYSDAGGAEHCIRSRFFVGADGKTGFTRKQYLEPRGVQMQIVHNMPYEETWVALNWKITLPTPETHPDFPLWQLGYEPEDVYDAFFPKDFRFICNPDRPAVCGRFGPRSDRLWRYEYIVLKGEDGMIMANDENAKNIIFPYLRHEAGRYGLTHEVVFPEDCLLCLRSRPFVFSARSCNIWAKDRVVLLGDAAHVFPPFGAQGIASGFRDAASLAWRLALLCRSPERSLKSCSKILEAWYSERKQQLDKSLAATIRNGEFVNERNPVSLAFRSWFYWVVSLVPSWRHQLRLGQRAEGMVRYCHEPGMPFIPEFGGGVCIPQVYCRRVGSSKAEILFTDQAIFDVQDQHLFRLFVYLEDVLGLSDAQEVVKNIHLCSMGELSAERVVYIIENCDAHQLASMSCSNKEAIYQVASADDFAASPLCSGRPYPHGYDPTRLRKELGGKRFAIARLDRFLFAVCDTKRELENAAAHATAYLGS